MLTWTLSYDPGTVNLRSTGRLLGAYEIGGDPLQRYRRYHRLIVAACGFWSDSAHCTQATVCRNSVEDVWQRQQSRQEQ